MKQHRWLVVVLIAALGSTGIGHAGGSTSAEPEAAGVRLPGHVIEALRTATRATAATAGSGTEAPIDLTVVLRRSDPEGFRAFLRDLYDPGSPRFRAFLSPKQLSDRFGPTQTDYEAVRTYFVEQGFTLAEGSANRLTLTLRGTRAQAERALSVRIGDYTLGGRSFHANDADPALPPEIASKVEAIAGLSDLGLPRHGPLTQEITFAIYCGIYKAFHLFRRILSNQVRDFSGEGNRFANAIEQCRKQVLPARPSAASRRGEDPPEVGDPYNVMKYRSHLPVDRPDGTGQTIGLVQFDTFKTSDVSDFLALIGAPAERIDNLREVHVNGGVATPGPGEAEVLLDIDVTLNLAPGATVVVFDAPRGTSWQTMFNAMIDNSVTIISNSWSSCENEHSLADVQSIDAILQTASAAGISVFNASGDTGSTCLNGSLDTVGVPASSPNATAVGGTSLMTSPGDVYGSETWWQDQGGFGVSRHFSRPAYQNGHSSSAMRSVPDVSILADPASGMLICQASRGGCPSGLLYGGTSMSAPLWASSAALLNDSQGLRIGAFNPALYPLSNTAAFHDAASMNSDFAHVGLGTPNLDVLDRLLASQTSGPPDPALSSVFRASTLVHELELPLLPLEVPADGTSAGVVCVILRDANGHTIADKTVVLTPGPGSTVDISPPSGTSSVANGAVVFKVTNLKAETVTFTATDTTDNLLLPQTVTVTFGVPSAASGGIEAFPLTLPANGTDSTTITITLRDALNRASPGKLVSILQGNGHSILTGPSPQVTDQNGQLQFTVVNGTNEAITYTAFDETDSVEVPGSVTVTFAGTGTSCVGTRPTAAPGFALTPFANGFVARSLVYSGVNWGACTGVSYPAFASDGSAYVTSFPAGDLYKLPSTGGTASGDNKLSTLGPTLSWPIFAPDGSLYASHGATGNGITSGDIVQVDPATGAILRTVVSNLTCPLVTIDPLSGDLFYDDICGGGGSDNPSIWRVHDPQSASPVVTVYATLPEAPGNTLSFAPDGTLYAAYAAGESSQGIARIDGTDQPSPPQVTILSDPQSIFFVQVAQAKADGSAKSLLVLADAGLQLVDITTNPYTVTPLTVGGLGTGAIGPDGCLYSAFHDVIYKLGPSSGGCGFVPSSLAPALSLSPSTVSPDPRPGDTLTFTATFRHLSVPAGTLVSFQIAGANTQPKIARTDAGGSATIQFTGHLPGTDTLSASATIGSARGASDQVLVSNQVRVNWNAAAVRAPSLGAALVLPGLFGLLWLRAVRRRRRSAYSGMER